MSLLFALQAFLDMRLLRFRGRASSHARTLSMTREAIMNSVEDLFYREGERDFWLSSKDSLSFWTCPVMRA
jgi:hypothetical protein